MKGLITHSKRTLGDSCSLNTADGLREGLRTLGTSDITFNGYLRAPVYGLEKVMVHVPVYADEKKNIESTDCTISTYQKRLVYI